MFRIGGRQYLEYIGENIWWIICTCISIVLSILIDGLFPHNNLAVSSIRMFVICELINFIVQLMVLRFSCRRKRVIRLHHFTTFEKK